MRLDFSKSKTKYKERRREEIYDSYTERRAILRNIYDSMRTDTHIDYFTIKISKNKIWIERRPSRCEHMPVYVVITYNIHTNKSRICIYTNQFDLHNRIEELNPHGRDIEWNAYDLSFGSHIITNAKNKRKTYYLINSVDNPNAYQMIEFKCNKRLVLNMF